MALDKNYQIVSLLRFTNLQWSRKYYEPGTFSMQIPIGQYSDEIRYIYTKDRPEMGKVTQKNFVNQQGYTYMQLSGYFLENEVNKHIAYKASTSNIVNSPAWTMQKGNAEDVALAFFNGFKTISATVGDNTVSSDLDIDSGESLSRGNVAEHTRNGENLGAKMYEILKPSELSYRVLYDFLTMKKKLQVWQGLDRTENNTDGNNPIVFSTKYGNIKNPNILIDETDYKNACIVANEKVVNNVSIIESRAVFEPSTEDTEYLFLNLFSGLNRDDYASGFTDALDAEASNALHNTPRTINVEFDAMEGSYVYGEDFDLGDKCNVEFPEINLSLEARLIGCYEVMKSGQWTMTMEFGTPVIIKK